MNRTFTDWGKFLSCIVIFIHHFYLSSPVVSSFGHIACAIFFFFSAYGISKSLDNNPMSMWRFAKRRLRKVYKPLLIVNLFFIMVTGILTIGQFEIPIFSVFCDKITFIAPLNHFEYALYLFGIKKIDSVTWFLDVLLMAYILIWVIQKNEVIKYRNRVTVDAYTIYLIGCAVFTPPIYYYVDTVGILLGIILANNETLICRYLNKGRGVGWLLMFMILGICIFLYEYHDILLGRYQKPLDFLLALLIVVLVARMAYQIKWKSNRAIAEFAGVSFFVYLCHVKIANLVFYCLGYPSFLLSLILVILISFILYKLNSKIL